MANAIGIDFGTTKTMVSFLNPVSGKAELVRLGRDRDSIPTTVHQDENGELLFGEDADDLVETDPEGYCRAFKLHLGENDPVLPRMEATAESLTRRFLAHIKNECEQNVFHGKRIDSATITIPVSFSPSRKAALKRAAEAAGFASVSFMPEPEAAGTAFLRDNPSDSFSRALVLDWGGGTLDIAIISRGEDGTIHADRHCAEGRDDVGGEEMDRLLLGAGNEIWNATFGSPLIESEENEPMLLREAEKVKIGLSRKDTVTFRRGTRKIDVSRAQFKQLIAEMLDSAVELVQSALAKNKNQGNPAPDAILLIGGTCQVPAVRAAMEQNFPSLHVLSWHHSHEAVALGATDGKQDSRPHDSRRPPSVPNQYRQDRVYASTYDSRRPPSVQNQYRQERIYESPRNEHTNTLQEDIAAAIARIEAYEDYSQASAADFHILEEAAQGGNMRAMSLLGSVYHHGCKGIMANPQKALECWRNAADEDSDAMMGLAMLYSGLDEESPVRKNMAEALKWAQKATDADTSIPNMAFLTILHSQVKSPDWKKVWEIGSRVIDRVGMKKPDQFSSDEAGLIGHVCFWLACASAQTGDEPNRVAMLEKGAAFGDEDCKQILEEEAQAQEVAEKQSEDGTFLVVDMALRLFARLSIVDGECNGKEIDFMEDWCPGSTTQSAWKRPLLDSETIEVLAAATVKAYDGNRETLSALEGVLRTFAECDGPINNAENAALSWISWFFRPDHVRLQLSTNPVPDNTPKQDHMSLSPADTLYPPIELSLRNGVVGGYVMKIKNKSSNAITVHVDSVHPPEEPIRADIPVQGLATAEVGWSDVDAARNFHMGESGTVSASGYSKVVKFSISRYSGSLLAEWS